MMNKTIVSINLTCNGSTGKIMLSTSELAKEREYDAWVVFPNIKPLTTYEKSIVMGKNLILRIMKKLGGLIGWGECLYIISTIRLLYKLNRIKPNLIHLHNLHSGFINIPMLFKYIKKHNIPIIWTLHDCWSFTGNCPCFDMVQCDKWKTGCHHCPQKKLFSKIFGDNSKMMWKLKKKWFTDIRNMTIATPSKWLADLVKQSYLKDYPTQVINNGVDLSIFKPTKGDFKNKYGIENKYIVLGIAFAWGERKGLDVFIELSKRLDEKYQIVLVGTNDNTDKVLPDNIISIHRTHNQTELAEIYTAADVFFNPTREDNYPTVNMEAIACGTPVITFDTGGSPECIDETCGMVIPQNDIEASEKAIKYVCEEKPFREEMCLKKAKDFDANTKFEEYLDLYNEKIVN